MKSSLPLFQFLRDAAQNGEQAALVTITNVIGGSSRDAGTHLAVSESGAWHGALSGGCIEAAVAAEAQRIIAAGTAETIRFGAGSRFIDIRLPCGGGLDLLFVPGPRLDVLDQICETLAARQTISLMLGTGAPYCTIADNIVETGWAGSTFQVRHDPDLRIVVIGHGSESIAMARQAMAYGADVMVLSPDPTVLLGVASLGARAVLLKTPGRNDHLRTDPYTAVAMLFHDHDWEIELLAQVLEQPCFYVGMMGSRATHGIRRERLAEHGVSEKNLARVIGPAGLIAATRDPDTLALSILAEIVAVRSKPAGYTP